MHLDQRNINLLFNYYIPVVDNICSDLDYDNNIKHLLYIVIPAFIAKYGTINEPTILKCFKNVKIFIKAHEKNVTAAFSRTLVKVDDEYKTNKFVSVNPFTESSIAEILDNLIHEFNHAINSINNEIEIDDKYIKVRTGLTYLYYNKKDLSFSHKGDETILEELLNTNDTEEVINLIKSFKDYDIENTEISNIVYNINHELGDNKYLSNAYKFQRDVCTDLINNKTFIPTANKFRLKGSIEEIPKLFDEVIDKPNSYKKLNELLTNMNSLIYKYEDSKLLKNKYLNNIKELANNVSKLIKEYDIKCIFR